MAAKTLTPKEIAQKFATDPKTLRKFLRKDAKNNGTENPGKGARWAIPATSLKSLQKRFDAWNATKHTEKEETVETPEGDIDPEILAMEDNDLVDGDNG